MTFEDRESNEAPDDGLNLEPGFRLCVAAFGEPVQMRTETTPDNKAKVLQKLAEEAKINAETTVDPNRRRALRVTALKYKRLANFVRAKGR